MNGCMFDRLWTQSAASSSQCVRLARLIPLTRLLACCCRLFQCASVWGPRSTILRRPRAAPAGACRRPVLPRNSDVPSLDATPTAWMEVRSNFACLAGSAGLAAALDIGLTACLDLPSPPAFAAAPACAGGWRRARRARAREREKEREDGGLAGRERGGREGGGDSGHSDTGPAHQPTCRQTALCCRLVSVGASQRHGPSKESSVDGPCHPVVRPCVCGAEPPRGRLVHASVQI